MQGSTRGLLETDHVILNHGQVTWTTPELTPPLLTTTPHQREDVSALDRFNVHRCPTRRVFSGTGLELVTRQATVRYLYHSTIEVIKMTVEYEAELAERWTELPQVSGESRSFFRVHTGYFSNIPKCIKAEFIASWACSQSSVVSSSKR
ncbi:uncharacterized protein TNCV_1565921 [Trichonephila clavipes]|nr:uncharacterized protein TNCV_1565921 [Trichonephila clavipes]